MVLRIYAGGKFGMREQNGKCNGCISQGGLVVMCNLSTVLFCPVVRFRNACIEVGPMLPFRNSSSECNSSRSKTIKKCSSISNDTFLRENYYFTFYFLTDLYIFLGSRL
jgi:hypothetical protein